MFHYWIIAIVLFQLSIVSQANFVCRVCGQILNIRNASDVINPTSCTNNAASKIMCKADLMMNYETGEASLQLSGVNNDSLPSDTTKDFIISNIIISLQHGNAIRTLTLYCLNNDSCLADMNATYNEIKKQNISALIKNVEAKLGNVSSPSKLLCRNNQNNQVSCPFGRCELINSGSNFQRRCNPNFVSSYILIQSVAVGDDTSKADFTYSCAKDFCNDGNTADSVRSLLDDAGLLEPKGVAVPKPSGSSVSSMIADTKMMILLSLMACSLVLFGH